MPGTPGVPGLSQLPCPCPVRCGPELETGTLYIVLARCNLDPYMWVWSPARYAFRTPGVQEAWAATVATSTSSYFGRGYLKEWGQLTVGLPRHRHRHQRLEPETKHFWVNKHTDDQHLASLAMSSQVCHRGSIALLVLLGLGAWGIVWGHGIRTGVQESRSPGFEKVPGCERLPGFQVVPAMVVTPGEDAGEGPTLEVKVLRAEGLAPGGHYVRVASVGEVHLTKFAQGENPAWDSAAYILHLPRPSTLQFGLWRDCGGPWDDILVGNATLPSSSFTDTAVEIPLTISVLSSGSEAKLWISGRVLDESRIPEVQVSPGPGCMAPFELCFDVQAIGRGWECVNAVKQGARDLRGINPGACPLTDLSYVGAGFVSRRAGWDGGMSFGPGPHNSQKLVNLSRICSRQLEIFSGHYPRVLPDAGVTCLKAFLEAVGKKEVPYIPILAHAIQLELKFTMVGADAGQEGYLMPTTHGTKYTKSYHIWALVDHCLDGLQRFLMSHNCWEAVGHGLQKPLPGADRPSSNVKALEGWFPLMGLGHFDPCPSTKA